MSDTKNQALYVVIFEDGQQFVGGSDFFDTKWREIPNKQISRIFYNLPSGDCICLNGYEKYYHMIEAIKDFTGHEKGKIKLQYAYIMGKKKNIVTSYRITLFQEQNDKYKLGDIVVRNFDINNDKIKGLNPKGWK